LSIWTVLGATPVPIFWIFVLCQFVWRPITAADASFHTSLNFLRGPKGPFGEGGA